MEKIFTRLPAGTEIHRKKLHRLKGAALTPYYWLMSRYHGSPGMAFRFHAAQAGMKLLLRRRGKIRDIYGLWFFPMDSFRYFEFDFMWKSVRGGTSPGDRYLDVSSPRLFPAVLLMNDTGISAEIVNPDIADLNVTREMMDALGIAPRCHFSKNVVEDLDYYPEAFDLIVSISAIEHIPGDGDRNAVAKLWGYLKPGGRLLLSMPCARQAFEEYFDFNEYGILQPDENGFVFGSLCYDSRLLEERIYSVAGTPIRYAIFGEKVKGSFFFNRNEKLTNPNYPFWRESYMMGTDYGYFQSIEELPGLGVIAMEFEKK